MTRGRNEYYDATLQLRPYDEEVINYVKRHMELNQVSIAKETKTKYGVDLNITSKKFAVQIGKKLKSRFGGTIKLSKSVLKFGKSASRNLFRVTVCFRLTKPL